MKPSLYILTALLTIVASSPSYAISEKDYEKVYAEKVVPFFNSGEFGRFPSSAGGEIYYGVFRVPNERGVVALSPGRSQQLDTYEELIYDIAMEGYSVCIIDHIGQGQSSRLLENPQIGHINDFNDYVLDFKFFMEQIVNPTDPTTGKAAHDKVFVLGHSMGAKIIENYLAEYQPKVDAAAFTAPMFDVNLRGLPRWVVHLLLIKATIFKQLNDYIPGGKDGDWVDKFKRTGTKSRARMAVKRETIEKNPTLAVGSPSYGWGVATAKAVNDKPIETAKKVNVPVIQFQVKRDNFVDNKAQNEFQKNAPNCRTVLLDTGFHDVLNLPDSLRDQILGNTFNFFRAH